MQQYIVLNMFLFESSKEKSQRLLIQGKLQVCLSNPSNPKKYAQGMQTIAIYIRQSDQKVIEMVVDYVKSTIKNEDIQPIRKYQAILLLKDLMKSHNKALGKYVVKKILKRLIILAHHKNHSKDEDRGKDIFGPVKKDQQVYAIKFLNTLLIAIEEWGKTFPKAADGPSQDFQSAYNNLLMDDVQFPQQIPKEILKPAPPMRNSREDLKPIYKSQSPAYQKKQVKIQSRPSVSINSAGEINEIKSSLKEINESLTFIRDLLTENGVQITPTIRDICQNLNVLTTKVKKLLIRIGNNQNFEEYSKKVKGIQDLMSKIQNDLRILNKDPDTHFPAFKKKYVKQCGKVIDLIAIEQMQKSKQSQTKPKPQNQTSVNHAINFEEEPKGPIIKQRNKYDSVHGGLGLQIQFKKDEEKFNTNQSAQSGRYGSFGGAAQRFHKNQKQAEKDPKKDETKTVPQIKNPKSSATVNMNRIQESHNESDMINSKQNPNKKQQPIKNEPKQQKPLFTGTGTYIPSSKFSKSSKQEQDFFAKAENNDRNPQNNLAQRRRKLHKEDQHQNKDGQLNQSSKQQSMGLSAFSVFNQSQKEKEQKQVSISNQQKQKSASISNQQKQVQKSKTQVKEESKQMSTEKEPKPPSIKELQPKNQNNFLLEGLVVRESLRDSFKQNEADFFNINNQNQRNSFKGNENDFFNVTNQSKRESFKANENDFFNQSRKGSQKFTENDFFNQSQHSKRDSKSIKSQKVVNPFEEEVNQFSNQANPFAIQNRIDNRAKTEQAPIDEGGFFNQYGTANFESMIKKPQESLKKEERSDHQSYKSKSNKSVVNPFAETNQNQSFKGSVHNPFGDQSSMQKSVQKSVSNNDVFAPPSNNVIVESLSQRYSFKNIEPVPINKNPVIKEVVPIFDDAVNQLNRSVQVQNPFMTNAPINPFEEKENQKSFSKYSNKSFKFDQQPPKSIAPPHKSIAPSQKNIQKTQNKEDGGFDFDDFADLQKSKQKSFDFFEQNQSQQKVQQTRKSKESQKEQFSISNFPNIEQQEASSVTDFFQKETAHQKQPELQKSIQFDDFDNFPARQSIRDNSIAQKKQAPVHKFSIEREPTVKSVHSREQKSQIDFFGNDKDLSKELQPKDQLSWNNFNNVNNSFQNFEKTYQMQPERKPKENVIDWAPFQQKSTHLKLQVDSVQKNQRQDEIFSEKQAQEIHHPYIPPPDFNEEKSIQLDFVDSQSISKIKKGIIWNPLSNRQPVKSLYYYNIQKQDLQKKIEELNQKKKIHQRKSEKVKYLKAKFNEVRQSYLQKMIKIESVLNQKQEYEAILKKTKEANDIKYKQIDQMKDKIKKVESIKRQILAKQKQLFDKMKNGIMEEEKKSNNHMKNNGAKWDMFNKNLQNFRNENSMIYSRFSQ